MGRILTVHCSEELVASAIGEVQFSVDHTNARVQVKADSLSIAIGCVQVLLFVN